MDQRAVEPVDDADRGDAQGGGAGGDRVEYQLQIAARIGDDVQDFRSGDLLFQRLARLRDEARVFRGDRVQQFRGGALRADRPIALGLKGAHLIPQPRILGGEIRLSNTRCRGLPHSTTLSARPSNGAARREPPYIDDMQLLLCNAQLTIPAPSAENGLMSSGVLPFTAQSDRIRPTRG